MLKTSSIRVLALLCTAVVLTVIVFPLSSSLMIGRATSARLRGISPSAGSVYWAPLPGKIQMRQERFALPVDAPRLLENGRPLAYDGHFATGIAAIGKGGFRVTRKGVYFSASDGTSPLKNGRTYVLKQSSLLVPAWLLLSFWGVAAAIWIYLGFLLFTSRLSRMLLDRAGTVLRPGWACVTEVCMRVQRVARKCFRTPWLHFAILGLATWLMFYDTRGQFPIQGDCVVAIQPVYSLQTLVDQGLLRSLEDRRFLPTSQNVTYHLLGDNFSTAAFVYIGIFIASVLVWYGILRSLFGGTPALLGALFFLCYSGKYETVTWFAAGMYTVVMFDAVLILGITRLKASPWLRLGLTIVLLWASLPFYEVLIMMIPVFSILYLGPCIFERRMPKASEWALSFGPVFPVLMHIGILAFSPNPIWNRSATDPDYQFPLYQKVWIGFSHSTSQTFGGDHFAFLERGIGGFARFVVPYRPAICLVVIALIVATGLAVAGRSAREARKNSLERGLYGLSGLYLAVFSGTITFVLGPIVPSRMTFLPSLGLGLLLAYLAFLAFRGASARDRPLLSMACVAGLVVISLMSIVEAVGMSGMVKIRESARACDQAIVNQLLAIAPHLPAGSEIYVSMQRPAQEAGIWKEEDSGFQSGNARGPLWYGYHCGINDISYFRDVWSVSEPLPQRFSGLVDRYSQGNIGKLYPFIVGPDLKVQGIRSVHLVDWQGNPAGELTFPAMNNANPGRVISVTASLFPIKKN